MSEKDNELILSFSTPLWTSLISNHKEVNEIMYRYIKSLQTKNPSGITKSNLMGWHSPDFDLNLKEPKFFINSISSNLNTVFNDMAWDVKQSEVKITSMWSIINTKDASNSRHIHSNNYISAAYYVKAPNNCGDIVFHDPRSAAVIRYPITRKTNKLNSNVFEDNVPAFCHW